MKNQKFLWLILPLLLVAYRPLVYLLCMPSLVGVAGVLVKVSLDGS